VTSVRESGGSLGGRVVSEGNFVTSVRESGGSLGS
jgi:hypothetical protein